MKDVSIFKILCLSVWALLEFVYQKNSEVEST